MSNPFKAGDKVVAKPDWDGRYADKGAVMEVTYTQSMGRVYVRGDYDSTVAWTTDKLRAAIAGQDYEVPAAPPEATWGLAPNLQANIGHLPDGSSVQKHSAGPLYPCVLATRDKRLKGPAKYDYGVISPRNAEPLWFGDSETAAQVAALIKKDIEA